MTDPEELRNRAASIFERLRQSGAVTESDAGDDLSGADPSGIAAAADPSSDSDAMTAEPGSRPVDDPGDPGSSASPGEAGPAGGIVAEEAVGPVREASLDHSAVESASTTRPGAPPTPEDDRPDRRPSAAADPAPADAEPPAADAGAPLAPAADLGRLTTGLEPPTATQPPAAGGQLPLGVGDELSVTPARATRVVPLTGLPDDLPILAADEGDTGEPGWRGRRPLPRILAIANQKGGVGKTTTAVNLGAALAELGYRVLVIDLDPQGNATTGLGINARNLDGSVYDVLLHDVPIEDCIEPTSLRNLFVVPATIDLAGAEIELVPVFSRELRLRRAVQRVIDDFDFVVVDCPPSLGLLTVNGLAAATEVVVPIQCEYYALEGLGQLLRNVNLVQANLNPVLEVTTIILTMYDARTRLAEQVVADVRAHFGDRVCRNVVPRTVRLSEAPSFGQPIIVFDSSSRGAIAYRELAKEVSGGAPQRIG